ncbi:unnamed protein product [Trifolium pratense]|uniref:Uncharacterized protein n=1 Tax=Trifolium pratense TaxID=57577 RepID=A0ACB0J9D5_TRIPR|nr:unnamed protein product [Trifolium pratense]
MVSVSKFALSCSMLVTIIIGFQLKGGKCSIFLPPKVHVYVTNNLTWGLQLGVHCKDKNHDKGFRSLHTGETYSFDFRPNAFMQNTLYFCGFTWNPNNLRYFDVYIQDRDSASCQHDCRYEIHQSGPCRIKINDIGPKSVECFEWNK